VTDRNWQQGAVVDNVISRTTCSLICTLHMERIPLYTESWCVPLVSCAPLVSC